MPKKKSPPKKKALTLAEAVEVHARAVNRLAKAGEDAVYALRGAIQILANRRPDLENNPEKNGPDPEKNGPDPEEEVEEDVDDVDPDEAGVL